MFLIRAVVYLFGFQNGKKTKCFHVRDGIILTKDMDSKIVQLLEEFIWTLGDTTSEGKSLLAKLKIKLAETLVLAFWPGPLADFIVIAGPDKKFGDIHFNSKR